MSTQPEFLFEGLATTALPCGNREVTANPVKVKLEAPKKVPVVRRDMTEEEAAAVDCLKKQVKTPPACWDKRFIRDVGLDGKITVKEAPQVWRLFHKYRRQITHPDKTWLLQMAANRAAPDLRKVAAQERERQRVQAHNAAITASPTPSARP